MANETLNNLKLGVFVTLGLAILIISLYIIGKNQAFFGANFHVRARFQNVAGLMTGNNVRFAGIQAGTVGNIKVVDDTTIELDMTIQKNMRGFIRQNSYAALGNDGLMGNKVINITPNHTPAPPMEEGGMLLTKRSPETDDMMQTFSNTNANVEKISESLIETMDRINNSKAFWTLLNDTTIPRNLSATMDNARKTAQRLDELTGTLNATLGDIRDGKGAAGLLLEDLKAADSIREMINNLHSTAERAKVAMSRTDSLIRLMKNDYATGRGPLPAMLKDSSMTAKMSRSLTNIEKATVTFNQDLLALQHNFLTRKYFKHLARQQADSAAR